jgi:hypothetical protein
LCLAIGSKAEGVYKAGMKDRSKSAIMRVPSTVTGGMVSVPAGEIDAAPPQSDAASNDVIAATQPSHSAAQGFPTPPRVRDHQLPPNGNMCCFVSINSAARKIAFPLGWKYGPTF